MKEIPIYSGKTACFFSTVPKDRLIFENYSVQDIRILNEIGFKVVVASSYSEIPYGCDLYFSWWASGSIYPLIKSIISRRPIIVIAGGNEAMLYSDSLYGVTAGYLNNPIYKKIATHLVLKFSSMVLIVSYFMIDSVRKLGVKNYSVVHNCVDTNLFYANDLVGDKYITSIFRTDEDVVRIKRGEVFIYAINEVVRNFPSQKFLIIGRAGNAAARLKMLVKNLALESNIIFIDEVANSSIVSLLHQTSLYVQISDTETFGVSIAEAMSCEVPVLVSHCGAIPEVVGPFGLYVDHNSPSSVAAGILSFLRMDKTEVIKISKALRVRVIEKFSYVSRKEKILEVINKLLH